MSNPLFPNLARSASTGVITGLELARIRRDRRDQRRRQSAQDAELSILNTQLSELNVDDQGQPRDINDIRQGQLNILRAASANPAFDVETRRSFAQQANQIDTNLTNLTTRAPQPQSTQGSALQLGFGGTTPPANTSTGTPTDGTVAPDLNLTPAVQATQVSTATDTSPTNALRNITPATPAGDQPASRSLLERARNATTNLIEGVDNTLGITPAGRRAAQERVNRSNLRSQADQIQGDTSAVQPRTRRITAPNGNQALVSTAIADENLLTRIVNISEQLVGTDGQGALGASSIQELVSLVENRLLELGFDPATISSEQFDELAASGNIFTQPSNQS